MIREEQHGFCKGRALLRNTQSSGAVSEVPDWSKQADAVHLDFEKVPNNGFYQRLLER